jgi:hypothetical protein
MEDAQTCCAQGEFLGRQLGVLLGSTTLQFAQLRREPADPYASWLPHLLTRPASLAQ